MQCCICVCSCIHTQTVVCRCYCTVDTASICSWITGVTCGTFISSAHYCVFNTCATCWTVLHFLCSKTSFSSQWKDVGVFTISALGYLRENMGDEIPSALPATYILSLVSAHPTPILLPFSLFAKSCLCQTFICILFGRNVITQPL